MGPGIWKLARNEKMKFENFNLEGFYLSTYHRSNGADDKDFNAILTTRYLCSCTYIFVCIYRLASERYKEALFM